jgi:hypothetical protein
MGGIWKPFATLSFFGVIVPVDERTVALESRRLRETSLVAATDMLPCRIEGVLLMEMEPPLVRGNRGTDAGDSRMAKFDVSKGWSGSREISSAKFF